MLHNIIKPLIAIIILMMAFIPINSYSNECPTGYIGSITYRYDVGVDPPDNSSCIDGCYYDHNRFSSAAVYENSTIIGYDYYFKISITGACSGGCISDDPNAPCPVPDVPTTACDGQACDTDNDGVPDATDPDDDNDGNPDETDPEPTNPDVGGDSGGGDDSGDGSSDNSDSQSPPPTEPEPDPEPEPCSINTLYNCTIGEQCTLLNQAGRELPPQCDCGDYATSPKCQEPSADPLVKDMLNNLRAINSKLASRLDNTRITNAVTQNTNVLRDAIENISLDTQPVVDSISTASGDIVDAVNNINSQGIIDAINSQSFNIDLDPTNQRLDSIINSLSPQTTYTESSRSSFNQSQSQTLLDEKKAEFEQLLADIQSQLSSITGGDLSTGSGQLPSVDFNVFGNHQIDLNKHASLLSVIGSILIAAAYLAAAMIIFGGKK